MHLKRFPLPALVAGPPQVRATVTNGYGLSTEALFDFDFTQSLDVDRQPDFTPSGFDEVSNMVFQPEGPLRLNVYQGALTSERILFPNEQRLSVAFVHESAGASHALGYVFYDDLVARGYVNTQGTPNSSDDTLVDANGNGIADLHEDLYNLAPPSGAQARPYIGAARRCAPRTFISQGVTLTQPELALNATCASIRASPTCWSPPTPPTTNGAWDTCCSSWPTTTTTRRPSTNWASSRTSSRWRMASPTTTSPGTTRTASSGPSTRIRASPPTTASWTWASSPPGRSSSSSW
ncbi:hypothetical protein ACIHQR_35565 [Corallococcus coralloides]|uniref:hypothetical protein n=1 Tax=Corallococcus coralloides TaxID=184914 RepID=UPI00384E143F